ncbi:CapA family protein [candidate division KSB1 bacterium]|nr:CapA family protein [candidate division KSB1 bacterium]
MIFCSDGSSVVSGGQESWSLVAGGDVCPIGRVEQILLSGGSEVLMGADLVRTLRDADLTLLNLESPVCATESPIRKTGPNFIASPLMLPPLKAAGMDIASLANNHVMDQGVEGLASTLEQLRNCEIHFHGAGLTHQQARRRLRLEICGKHVSFINVAEGEFAQCLENGAGAARLEPVLTCAEIARAREDCEIVIVSVHAGNEYQPFPSPYIQRLYRHFVDAGADLVLGHHPHIPQGIEKYARGLIIYSLGNFLFDYAGHVGKTCTRIGFLVRIGFDDSNICSIRAIPFRQRDDATVRQLSREQLPIFADYLNAVSEPLSSEDGLRALWEQQVRQLFQSTYQPLFETHYQALVKPLNIDTLASCVFFNLFRCEAHNEALKTAFRLMHESRFEEDAEARMRIDAVLEILEKLVNSD